MRNKRLIIIFSILLGVTTLVLLTSIIFSVKTVSAYCYNYIDNETDDGGISLDKRVTDSVSLKGHSVFLINDKQVIADIEKKVTDVKVVNVERIFPNRVQINYVRMFNYFEVKVGDAYYQCRCDGKVSQILDAPSSENRIKIYAGITKHVKVNEYIFTAENSAFLSECVTAFEQLKLKENAAAAMFEFIDISKQADVVYVGVRNSDVVIRIYGRNNFFEKLRKAYSTYVSDKFDETVEKTITVTNDKAVTTSDTVVYVR